MNLWPAAAVAAVMLAAAASKGSDMGDDANIGGKLRVWNRLVQYDALDHTQRYFLMLTAYGEGGYQLDAHNGTDSERAASKRAADANPTIVARALGCGVPYAHLVSGSWTMFQLLAPYVAGTVFEIFGNAGCAFADPHRVASDIDLQLCVAIEHARDLQGYKGFTAHPTVGNLRLGWASPSYMGYLSEQAARLQKYRAQASKQRFPKGIVDATIAKFPENVAQLYADMRNVPEQ